jgi:putative endonuclease
VISDSRKELGRDAEEYTAEYLRQLGFSILSRNFYIRGGEIDIIAERGDLVVFVEVRSWDRSYWDGGTPLETITEAKIRNIVKTALFFMQKSRINIDKRDIRFDAAGLIRDGKGGFDIRYIEGAFTAEGFI